MHKRSRRHDRSSEVSADVNCFNPCSFVLIILLNFLGLASPVTNAIGFLLPAYLSISALESELVAPEPTSLPTH